MPRNTSPLPVVRIRRHEEQKGTDGTGTTGLPDEYGGGIVSVRLFQNAEDDRRDVNRTENPAKGWRRQMALLLGYARVVNKITLARCRARAAPPAAA